MTARAIVAGRSLLGLLLLGVLLAAGCAQRPMLPDAAIDANTAEQAQLYAARLQRLDALDGWHVNGRLGLSHDGEQVALTLNLQRFDAERWRLNLHGPMAGGSIRLDGDSEQVVMRGVDGVDAVAADGRTLLLRETGHDLPAEALGAWLQGRHWSPAGEPEALELDDDGRPLRIEQLGWDIRYGLYRDVHALAIAVPHRIEARRDDLGVRVVIAQWRSIDERAL